MDTTLPSVVSAESLARIPFLKSGPTLSVLSPVSVSSLAAKQLLLCRLLDRHTPRLAGPGPTVPPHFNGWRAPRMPCPSAPTVLGEVPDSGSGRACPLRRKSRLLEKTDHDPADTS